MEHRYVVLRFLVPTYQDPAEPVHPTICPLYYPPPRFSSSGPFQLLRLFAARTDVCREAELLDDLPHCVIVVALIQAHALRLVGRRLWPFDRNALQGLLNQLHVVAIGAVHGQADRNSLSLHQQAALGTLLGAIGRVFAGLFPPRGVPWSCTRPCSPRTSRDLSSRRRPASRTPTFPGRRRLRPTPGSGRGLWSRDKNAWRSTPSTGSRCGEGKGWLPAQPGRGSG